MCGVVSAPVDDAGIDFDIGAKVLSFISGDFNPALDLWKDGGWYGWNGATQFVTASPPSAFDTVVCPTAAGSYSPDLVSTDAPRNYVVCLRTASGAIGKYVGTGAVSVGVGAWDSASIGVVGAVSLKFARLIA